MRNAAHPPGKVIRSRVCGWEFLIPNSYFLILPNSYFLIHGVVLP
jgi:hypothetical protein